MRPVASPSLPMPLNRQLNLESPGSFHYNLEYKVLEFSEVHEPILLDGVDLNIGTDCFQHPQNPCLVLLTQCCMLELSCLYAALSPRWLPKATVTYAKF